MFSLFDKPKHEIDEDEEVCQTGSQRPRGLGALLSRNALPGVALLFGLGLALTYAQLSHNQDILVQRTALQHAAVYSHTLDRFRALYADEVVDTARGAGLRISHDYLTEKDTIPLPITLSRRLEEDLKKGGATTMLYSPFPFPWRRAEGGLRDDFARDAWKALNENPDEPFYRVERYGGVTSMRYAIAEKMQQRCVTCHNEYAGSPRRDWEAGDVRGVLEVVYPIEQAKSLAEGSVWETLGIMSPMLLLALAMLGLTTNQHRRWTFKLEERVMAQHRAQRALERSEARYRTVLETAPDVILILSRDGRIDFINRVEDTHYVRATQGMSVFAYMDEANAETMRDAMNHALETGELWSYQIATDVQGERRWYSSRIQRLGVGDDDRLLVFSTDVTSKRRALRTMAENADLRSRVDAQTRELLRSRKALLSNEQRLFQVLESMPLGVLVLDRKGRTEYANDNAVELLGDSVLSGWWTGESIAARACVAGTDEDYPVDDRPATRALRGESSTVIDLELHRGEEVIPLLVSGAPIFDEEGEVILAIVAVQDISEQKRLERQVYQAQRMQAVGRLAGGVAHDFNNLLTTIVSFGTFAMRRLDPDDKSYRDLQQVLGAANRGGNLTRQLLAFSRHQSVNSHVVNVNDTVRAIDQMLRRLLGEHVELQTELRKSVKNIRIEAGALDQVLINLALNARDAMPGGGLLRIETDDVFVDEEYAREHELALAEGIYVCVSVSDDGTGMDEETKRQMFDPFFTTKGPGKGTGLGLSTCWGIAKKAGGQILVESEPGKGTTIQVYLPGVDAEVTIEQQEFGPLTTSGEERIVVAEDDESVRSLIVRTLKSAGYRVLEACDGEEAAEYCEVSPPGSIDLLLTDVVMPRLNGPDLAERVARTHPNVKVLYVSGYTDDMIVDHGVVEKGIVLLQKPFSPEILAQKVRDVLDSDRRNEEADATRTGG